MCIMFEVYFGLIENAVEMTVVHRQVHVHQFPWDILKIQSVWRWRTTQAHVYRFAGCGAVIMFQVPAAALLQADKARH